MPPLLRFVGIVVCVEVAAAGLYSMIHYFSEGLPSFLFNFNWMAVFTFAAVAIWRAEPR